MEEYLIIPEQKFMFIAFHEKSKRIFKVEGKFSGILEGIVSYDNEPNCIMPQVKTRILMGVHADKVNFIEDKK